jgi:hypothetical protein
MLDLKFELSLANAGGPSNASISYRSISSGPAFLTILVGFRGFQSFATKLAKANNEGRDDVRLATIPVHVDKQMN